MPLPVHRASTEYKFSDRLTLQALEDMEGLDEPTAAMVRNNAAADACSRASAAAPKKAAADALKRLDGLFERAGTDGQPKLAPSLEVTTVGLQWHSRKGNNWAALSDSKAIRPRWHLGTICRAC